MNKTWLKLNLKDLNHELNQIRSKLLTLQFQIATGNNNEFNKVKNHKKEIAQILTLINQRRNQHFD